MSDYRVVAAVMATVQNMLQDAIGEAAPGAVVRTGPPEEEAPDQVAEGLVKVFLFRVEPNPTMRNAELPVRAADGRVIKQPQMAVNLDILFSFYGNERRKIPYLLLGLTLAALHAEPYPSVRHMPRTSAAGGNGSPDPVSASLAGSGLELQSHALRLSLLPLGHEELFPLFSHIPFVMSVAYRAQVVLIEPFANPEPALPVRRADFFVPPQAPPLLERVEPALLTWAAGAEVVLSGQQLAAGTGQAAGAGLRVLFDDLEAEPRVESSRSLRCFLPDGLQAGMHLVRVVRPAGGGEGSPNVESNPLALAVEPVVREARATLSGDGSSVELRVAFEPEVWATTPVVVLLNPVSDAAGNRPSRAYAVSGRVEPTVPDRVDLEVDVEPGSYLVRLQIDGVTSRLATGPDGTFDAPRVEIPEVPPDASEGEGPR